MKVKEIERLEELLSRSWNDKQISKLKAAIERHKLID